MGVVIDVTWVLSEETGRLRYENMRRVRGRPKQKLIVEHVREDLTPDWSNRYRRIVEDRRTRGLDND